MEQVIFVRASLISRPTKSKPASPVTFLALALPAWSKIKCYTSLVYAQKFRVDVIVGGQRKPCPLDWLDAFCMRNFTGSAEFDDTLPLSEGQMEASLKVNPDKFAAAFAEWLTKRGKVNGRPVTIDIHPA